MNNTPNLDELYALIKDLTSKYNRLEQSHCLLKNYVYSNNGKINIDDILSASENPAISYTEWLDRLDIRKTHLEYVFKSGYIDGIYLIIEDIFKGNDETIPVRVFRREKSFYTYKDYKWYKSNICEIISIIAKALLCLFKEWQEENQPKMTSEKFSNLYFEYLKKILGGNTPIDIQNRKIANKFYKGS